MRSLPKQMLLAILLLFLQGQSVIGAEPVSEIEYLLHTIGQSVCSFVRNGSEHTAPEAAEHLRMKYNRAKSRVKTAEAFIDRLASNSSWTGKPYTIRCAGGSVERSSQWLYRELDLYRNP